MAPRTFTCIHSLRKCRYRGERVSAPRTSAPLPGEVRLIQTTTAVTDWTSPWHRGPAAPHHIKSRRTERIFGADGPGRSSRLRAGIKLEKIDEEYDPRTDTCVRAYVRLLYEQVRARAGAGEE